ncbi:ATP-grasp domain-containing protein [Labedaea rhizosphaerae]|uniref:Biotin carboxylase n=1 Tax=Labedaea rhizosphaerae TaxID=598644 RepID=A0A4R6S4A5_LABRH|nr:ATP-grasp domain-containing protein [Labedaea rhizosphaerae]TDP94064.1 biotin carboxylase [Labedaea rhizosphaerae]
MSVIVFVESNTTGTGRLFCRRAREFGLHPVLLAKNPARFPYVEADGIEHHVVDTDDPAAVLAAVKGLDRPIVGVASSSEYWVATAGEVAAALGLPHPDPDAVRACRDKARQRATLHAAGVPGAEFAAARTPDEAVGHAERIGFPVVVKPVAGSGSVATRLCRTPDEVRGAARLVLASDPAELGLPPQDAVLVEEYLDGPEFSVETLGTQVVGVTAKHLGPAPWFVEVGHDFPVDEPVGPTAVAALRALGLGWGAAHVEVRVTASGPRIIEVNPRLAGGMIPRVIEAATGIDVIAHVVAIAAGLPRPAAPARAGHASIRFLVAERSGVLDEVAGLDEARAADHVVEVELTKPVGTEITLRHSFTDRLGYAIAATDETGSGSVAARAAEEAVRTVRAHVAPISFAAEGTAG